MHARERVHAVIAGECQNDSCRIAKRGERVEKRAEIAVEPYDLIVDFLGVGAEGVAHCVGRRQGDRQQVYLRPLAQVEGAQPGKRGFERDLVHLGIAGERLECRGRIGRERMREHEVLAAILDWNAVGLRICVSGQERRPGLSGK